MNKVIHTQKGQVHLCPNYGEDRGKCSSTECKKLHVCRAWLAGFCRYDPSCDLEHSLHTEHNKQVLQELGVEVLPCDENLRDRLVRSLPALCVHHLHKMCYFGNKRCEKLHMCGQLLSKGFCATRPLADSRAGSSNAVEGDG